MPKPNIKILFKFVFFDYWNCIPTVIGQKGESQNGYFNKTKHAKFSEKRTFTPWYAKDTVTEDTESSGESSS